MCREGRPAGRPARDGKFFFTCLVVYSLSPCIENIDVLKTNARRTWHIALGPTDIPHTRRPRARPTPAGRKGSDSLGRKVEYLALHVREILENQQEITTFTVIWARQLVSPQPKLGPVP